MTCQFDEVVHVAIDNANLLIFRAAQPTMVLVLVPALGVRAEYYALFARALNRP
jgi:hypothetical protein